MSSENLLIMLGETFEIMQLLINCHINFENSKIIICSSNSFLFQEFFCDKELNFQNILTTFNNTINPFETLNTYKQVLSSILFVKQIINKNKYKNIYFFTSKKEAKRVLTIGSLLLINVEKIRVIYNKHEKVSEDELKNEEELIYKFRVDYKNKLYH